MESYKIETKMTSNGQFILQGLPFMAGEPIEVIVLALPKMESSESHDPLRNSVVKYDDPFEPVATQHWGF